MPASSAFSGMAEDSSFTPCCVFLWLESRTEIAPDRRAAAAQRGFDEWPAAGGHPVSGFAELPLSESSLQQSTGLGPRK